MAKQLEEKWSISGVGYRIVTNDGGQNFRVEKRQPGQSVEVLSRPEESFETTAGARYAILLDLED